MCDFPPSRKGKCCPFSSFCVFRVWFGVFCRFFSVFLFLRSLFEKDFRERTFVFGWGCWSCVFWWVFAYVFALFLGGSLLKVFGNNSFDVKSGVFWGRSLFLWFFFVDVVFCVF